MYEKFALLLKSRNISAADVSKATKISPSTLSEWKSGKYTPKMDKIQKIADYFKVDVSYFLDENEQQDTPKANKDQRDLNEFLNNTEIMFDGELHQVDEEDRAKLRQALEFVFWQAKEKNKRKPTK